MRAGIFQCKGGGLTPDQRIERLAMALADERFDLVVCPELFMSGYDIDEAVMTHAEPVNGPFSKRVAELARSVGTAIVYGYPERDGDRLYNSAVCLDKSGEIVANHRKFILPPGFEARYFEPGNGLTLFVLDGYRCATLVCYDAEFPETVRAAAEAGAEIIIVPTALIDAWGSVAFQMMPSRAFENGVCLLYANHAGVENGSRYLGASCIVAPDGSDAARAGAAEELLCAGLDRESVATAQARLPYIKDVQAIRALLGGHS